MSNVQTPVPASSPELTLTPAQTVRARRILGLAALLAVGSIAAFAAQVFWARLLVTPWYLPVGGTLAALLAILAISGRRAWLAIAAAVALVGLAAMEWYFVVGLTALPEYAGPAKVGAMIPEFEARLADGSRFDDSFFRRDQEAVLIFFQGRWCPFCMTQLKQLEAEHARFADRNTNIVVVSVEDIEAAKQTQQDFPHLVVVSDEQQNISQAIDLVNKGFAPDGSDAATPTILLIDHQGIVQWLHRPARFIERPAPAELAAKIDQFRKP